ncbi:hypothetical protein LTR14_012189, partial [Exophiala xenobiotica]
MYYQDPPDTGYRELLRVPMPSEPLNYESSMTLGDALELSLGADAAPGPCLEADERLFAETALAISTHRPDLLDIDMQSSVQRDKEMVRLAEQTLDQWQICDSNLAAEFFDLSHPEIFVPEQDGIPYSCSTSDMATPLPPAGRTCMIGTSITPTHTTDQGGILRPREL